MQHEWVGVQAVGSNARVHVGVCGMTVGSFPLYDAGSVGSLDVVVAARWGIAGVVAVARRKSPAAFGSLVVVVGNLVADRNSVGVSGILKLWRWGMSFPSVDVVLGK